MEVRLDKRYPLAVGPEQAWAVLADIRAVAGCMPGAQITEELDPTHFKGTVRSKVGPAVMSFAGDVELLAVDPATRTLELAAKGADRSGSSAAMKLQARIEPGEDPASAVLAGQSTVIVTGKLAQFGNRLLVPVADAMLAQFADNFRAAAAGGAGDAGEAHAADRAAPGSTVVEPARTAPRELDALALVWAVIKGWFARLFGRRPAGS